MAALRLPESLSLFMYREPKSAKRLYVRRDPRTSTNYQQFLEGFSRAKDAGSSSKIRSGTSMRTSAQGRTCRSRFQLLLTLCRRRMRKTPLRCGFSGAIAPA